MLERHLLAEAVSFSLSSLISASLIIRPRAASALIQPKTLMEDNEAHSFPSGEQTSSGDTLKHALTPSLTALPYRGTRQMCLM